MRAASLIALAIVVTFVVAPLVFPNRAPLGLLLQGVELGAVNGLLALGLVLTYRANRVVNFAFGAMGGLAGTVGVMLYLGQHWNWFLSLGIGLALGGIIGMLVDGLLRWRFAKSPRLVVMVATIGLSQVLGGLQALVPGWLHGPELLGAFSTPLSRFHVDIRPVLFDGNDLLVLIVLLVVPAALSWFLLRTGAGIAIRSLSENPERAQLLGIPVQTLSMLVWVVAGVLAALTVMVNAPSQGVTASVLSGPTLLLPALAAAVIARMENLPVAFGSAIALGVINSVVAFNIAQTSVTDVVFLGVILLALFLQRRRRDGGGQSGDVWMNTGVQRGIPAVLRRLPEVRITKGVIALALAALVILVPIVGGPGSTLEYTIAICLGISALSLVVLSGWSGNVSLGQFAFAGVGGVLAGDLIEKWNVDFIQCLVAAAAAGACLAIVVGLPALRVRGDFLAVTTLALAVCVNTFFLNPTNFDSIIPHEFFRPLFLGRFNLASDRTYYYFCLGVLLLVVLFIKGLRHARTGRVLLATRDNLIAAEAMAVPTVRVRLGASALSGALAGLSGALYATTLGSVGVNTFDPSISLLIFAMAVIGGMGSISGALIGVAVIQIATYSFPTYQQITAGSGLLLILLFLPGGLSEGISLMRDMALRVVARRRHLVVPSLFNTRETTDETPPPERAVPVLAAASTNGSPPHADVLLHCSSVATSYGPVRILFGVDFDVRQGELVALLGTNGAGKSTLLRCISGLMALDGGVIALRGRRLSGNDPDAVVRKHVALMPGGRGIFSGLTVDENLRLSTWLLRKGPERAEIARGQMLELFPVLSSRLAQRAGSLSGGEQQMLSLAMALMVTPDLLLIDELSLGLSPTIVAELLDVLRMLHATGMTIVVVEQSLNVALELAERAVFMEKGEVRFSGRAGDLLERTDLLRSVFLEGSNGAPTSNGHSLALQSGERVIDTEAAPVLRCVGVSKQFGGVHAARDVSLSLYDGEILGLIGHNGAGKTTLMNLISGFVANDAGTIAFGSMDVGWMSPSQRAMTGLGRTFQEARLFPSLTVRETLAVALERHLESRSLVAAGFHLPASLDSEYDVSRRVDDLLELMGLQLFAEKFIGELSTGTRRIVELACVVAQEPKVLLLDEPSAGVAQRESEAMGPLLHRVQRETGCSMMIIEHDMPLLKNVCDRLVALELGEVIAVGTPDDVMAHPKVIASYLGTNEVSIHRSGGAAPASELEAAGGATAAYAASSSATTVSVAPSPTHQRLADFEYRSVPYALPVAPVGPQGRRSYTGFKHWRYVPAAHRRWILLNAVFISALWNLTINWVDALVLSNHKHTIHLWATPIVGPPNLLWGTLQTLFFLPFFTGVGITMAVRKARAKGVIEDLEPHQRLPGWFGRLPANVWTRALAIGVAMLAIFGPICALVLVLGFGHGISRGHYVAYCAIFGLVLGLLITAPIALRAMGDPLPEAVVEMPSS